MKPASADTWSWVLIYGGLLLASLSAFLWGGDAVLAGAVLTAGAAATVAGIGLIVLRSRMDRDPPRAPPPGGPGSPG